MNNWNFMPEIVYDQICWYVYALCAAAFVGVLTFGPLYHARPF